MGDPQASTEASARDRSPALGQRSRHSADLTQEGAVLGHWLFGYIHPYPDGNGRMARFLMNVMLASGGYPWTVIRVEDRDAYLAALDRASIDMDIKSFAGFVAQRVKWSLEQRKRELKFPAPKETEDFKGDSVVFWGQDGEKRVRCEIIRDVLDDHFGGGGKDKLTVFRAKRRAIEELARRKYLSGRTEADESVLIGSEDV